MADSLVGNYDPSNIEDKWYTHWIDQGYFHSEPDERPAYSIVIPPPNVTGVLHMGHMLNNTIQDILTRNARKKGFNACWVPGTDHASIATEAKVVKMLREQGIKKSELTRDQFLEKAYEWKEKYGGIILQQLRKLGASCDWDRTAFTMDDIRNEHVLKAFVDLYNEGKLYRKKRMINWDPEAQTVLSNEEVIYKEENRKLYTVRYRIKDSSEYLQIATTRPETIMGDSGIAVHPEDPRYSHLKGKKAIVPLVNREVPIIFDEYVDREFGTGALKITPAHDMNDHELGQKYNLEVIDIFHPDGTLNKEAQVFVGQDRFVARDSVVRALKESEDMIEIEDYRSNIGRSERTDALVEPRLSLQWYVDMNSLAKPALDAVESDEVEFFPKNQKNLYRHWMTNIRDWCISRQLWWGQRIPAFYLEDEVFVALNYKEAAKMASAKLGREVDEEELKQDEDVLDTWFSSWLWPISLFNGFNTKEELDYYYPTSVLVTGWDIIFLWVARMIMAGYEWTGERPFDDVYFTGMVRDKKRRKMSKSLGNSPDALKLIDEFGADGVRFGIMSSSPAGGDLLFDEKLCENGRNFCNKMWNALKLIQGLEIDSSMEQSDKNALAVAWMESNIDQAIQDLDDNFTQYRLSENVIKLHHLIWNDFCSWYLEMIKPPYGEKIDAKTIQDSKVLMSKLMNLLHPYMPFITEELWHQLGNKDEDLCVASYPTQGTINEELLTSMNKTKELISKVREVRAKAELKKSEIIDLFYEKESSDFIADASEGIVDIICTLTNSTAISSFEEEQDQLVSFLSGTTKYFAKIDKEIDVEAEIEKLEDELKRLQGFLIGVQKKLSNQGFVNNAPAAVVDKEKQKAQDTAARIEIIKDNLSSLQS